REESARERRARLRLAARDGRGREVAGVLLGGLLREPRVGNEGVELVEGMPGLEARDDVDQGLANALGAERSARALDDGVRRGEPRGGDLGPREHEVLPSECDLADRALDAAGVELEASVGEAPAEEGLLVQEVSGRFGERVLWP